MPFHSIKTYGAERGLSCVFRQWDARTDCQLMHGYSLGFRFTFAAETLDRRGWVLDFGEGGFGAVRRWLHATFDHTLLVAADDPAREKFEELARCGLADIRMVPGTSCERLAQHVFAMVQPMVHDATQGDAACVRSSASSTEPIAPSMSNRTPSFSRPSTTSCGRCSRGFNRRRPLDAGQSCRPAAFCRSARRAPSRTLG